MHVICRVWGPVPSSSGDAEYSPRPDVRLKPGNGGMGEWGNGIIEEWENGGMGVHEDDIGMVKVVRYIYIPECNTTESRTGDGRLGVHKWKEKQSACKIICGPGIL